MKKEFIRYAPIFSGLNDSEQELLAEHFTPGQSIEGEQLFKAGEKSDSLYLLSQGFVRLSTNTGQDLATLGPGSILGEMGLLQGSTQDINAVALSPLEFWQLSDQSLRKVILQQPSIGIKLSGTVGGRLAQMEDYLVEQLASTKELGNLPHHTLQAVATNLTVHEVKANQPLYHAGDPPAGLFLVESGLVALQAENSTTSQTAQKGALLGAFALLTNKAYQENAVAREDTLLWVLPSDAFQIVNSQHPGFRRSLGQNVRSRLSPPDQAKAAMRLAQMPLFAGLPSEAIQGVAQRLVLQHVPAGVRVYRVGEVGDALYLIENGEIGSSSENASGFIVEQERVGDGGFFGEASLLTGQLRAEDATATRHTNLWVLYKADLDQLVAQYPVIGNALNQGVATRLATEEAAPDEERFRQYELFANLQSNDLRQVARYLRPTRYQAGEPIYRASSEGDMLFLVENGQVRVQSFNGAAWLLGPGESFGERSLLTNQPRSETVIAESDADLWSLSKRDFDHLLTRYPHLAINLSRILSQRLENANIGTQVPAVMEEASFVQAPAGPSSRRHRAAFNTYESEQSGGGGSGILQWFGNLSTVGKLAVSFVILLLIWLVGVAGPMALFSVLSGDVASGASAPLSANALGAVQTIGSFEVAATDKESAIQVALADQQVPPTATYTPLPTNTPISTNTSMPTHTPTRRLPTLTPTPVPINLQPVQPIIQAAQQLLPEQKAAPAPAPEEKVEAAAAPAPPPSARNWDSRLDRLGVRVEEASVGSGQQYWQLVDVKWQDEHESGGKHHLFVEVLDENGQRIVGQTVSVYWSGGGHSGKTEDKNPPDYAYNYPMFKHSQSYNVKIEGLPSDALIGAGLGSIDQRQWNIHVNYLLTFKRATKP